MTQISSRSPSVGDEVFQPILSKSTSKSHKTTEASPHDSWPEKSPSNYLSNTSSMDYAQRSNKKHRKHKKHHKRQYYPTRSKSRSPFEHHRDERRYRKKSRSRSPDLKKKKSITPPSLKHCSPPSRRRSWSRTPPLPSSLFYSKRRRDRSSSGNRYQDRNAERSRDRSEKDIRERLEKNWSPHRMKFSQKTSYPRSPPSRQRKYSRDVSPLQKSSDINLSRDKTDQTYRSKHSQWSHEQGRTLAANRKRSRDRSTPFDRSRERSSPRYRSSHSPGTRRVGRSSLSPRSSRSSRSSRSPRTPQSPHKSKEKDDELRPRSINALERSRGRNSPLGGRRSRDRGSSYDRLRDKTPRHRYGDSPLSKRPRSPLISPQSPQLPRSPRIAIPRTPPSPYKSKDSYEDVRSRNSGSIVLDNNRYSSSSLAAELMKQQKFKRRKLEEGHSNDVLTPPRPKNCSNLAINSNNQITNNIISDTAQQHNGFINMRTSTLPQLPLPLPLGSMSRPHQSKISQTSKSRLTQLPLPVATPLETDKEDQNTVTVQTIRPRIINKTYPFYQDQAPRCVDVFDIISQIGEGTYGQVYKAQDKINK